MKFNKKGFVWYLFQKEVMFFAVGFAVGFAFIVAWAYGIIPIPLDICGLM